MGRNIYLILMTATLITLLSQILKQWYVLCYQLTGDGTIGGTELGNKGIEELLDIIIQT